MGATGSVTPAAAQPPTGSRPGGGAAAATTLAVMRAALRAPLTRRARAESLYCLIAVPLGIAVPVGALGFVLTLGWLAPGAAKPENASIGGLVAALLVLLVLATRGARRLGAVHRHLAARLLGEQVAPPSPFRPGRGVAGWLDGSLRDATGWRAVAYLPLKLPTAVVEGYALAFWVTGLVNLSYPLWWGLFRNHPPNVQLRPVPVVTPFSGELFQVTTYIGTFGAVAVGAALLLAAPWVTRAATSTDRWLIRGLLGPDRLAQRVRDLEQTRARAVEDSAALLRRLERDLHDGAQIRLATLAMNLGRAKEKLGDHSDTLDLTAVRELVDAAHQGAKDALIELRDLARGIHPPVLDTGLADALATLTSGSAIPVELTTHIPIRPTPAIETIAYFCATELLANAAKHSHANMVRIQVAGRDGLLVLSVTDDGVGGADPAHGSGLYGLGQRVRTVDGRLDIASPPGGPTVVTAVLPLHP
jgi:signal transduction histidine kinase